MRRQHLWFLTVLCGMLILLMPIELSSQTMAPARPAFPDYVLYEGFLRNIALINRKATELDRSGGRSGLREAVCARLGLGAKDCALLLQTVTAVEAQLTPLDKRAQSIIDEVRRKHKERAAGSVLPPPPQELAQLQAQRNSLIGTAVAALKQQLTPRQYHR